MRPTPGVDPPAPRSRKSSSADRHQLQSFLPTSGPTSFFLASENELERALASNAPLLQIQQTGSPTQVEKPISKDGVYGVQSLEDALDEAFSGRADDETADQERDAGDGDMLYRLLRMRKKKSRATTPKPSPAAASPEKNVREGEQDDRGTRSAEPSTPRSTARSNSPLLRHPRRPSHTTISQPLTPLMANSPTPFDSACPSSPKSGSMKSLRLSEDGDALTEDNASQAIVSSDEEDNGIGAETEQERERMSASAPELVMPSLSMPRRRPFTARGKKIGRLKMCVVGMKGAGKSTLVRAIVHQCEDIIHVDPVAVVSVPNLIAQPREPKGNARPKAGSGGAVRMTEVFASTKPYPPWWTETEETRLNRRKKSLEETILDRNLCIIDTPGYSIGISDAQDQAIGYIESLFHHNLTLSALGDNDLFNVLTGNGGVQVDLVLFIFSPESELCPQVDYFKRLTVLTNVVPLVGKADILDPEALLEFKRSILDALRTSSARPFLFGTSISEALDMCKAPQDQEAHGENQVSAAEPSSSRVSNQTLGEPSQTPRPKAEPSIIQPFAISTLPGSDEQEMDASLLMSSSYNPPLVPSDLRHLISLVFDPEHVAWIRHNSTRKFLSWRHQRQLGGSLNGDGDSMLMNGGALSMGQGNPPSPTRPPASQVAISRQPRTAGLSPFNLSSTANLGVSLSDVTQARLRDRVAREETLVQMQLTRWASDLQRAMQQERAQFETLMKGERAKWLLEKINEEVRTGNIGAIDSEGVIQRLPISDSIVSKESRKASGCTPPAWSLATKRRARRGAELPSWARPKGKRRDRVNPEDPLGLCQMGDNVRQTGSTVMKVVGGSVVVTAAYFAVVSAIHRFHGPASEPDAWAPRWLTSLMQRFLWPDEPRMWV